MDIEQKRPHFHIIFPYQTVHFNICSLYSPIFLASALFSILAVDSNLSVCPLDSVQWNGMDCELWIFVLGQSHYFMCQSRVMRDVCIPEMVLPVNVYGWNRQPMWITKIHNVFDFPLVLTQNPQRIDIVIYVIRPNSFKWEIFLFKRAQKT